MAKSSKEQIIDSAAALLLDRGYNAFSFADISADVGLAKATIHHHFASKEELVVEVLVHYREQINGGLAFLSSEKEKPLDRLKGYCAYWQKCIETNERPFCICVLLASEMPSLPKAVAAQVEIHFKELGEWIASNISEGKKNGSIRTKLSAKAEADVFRALVHGAMVSARALGDKELFAVVIHHALSNLAAK